MNLILVLLLLASLTLADTFKTTDNADALGQDVSSCLSQYRRREKRAEIKYAFTLTNTNQWTQLPSMEISFQLPFEQYITIWQNFVLQTTQANLLAMRTIIDGQQNTDYRSMTGYSKYHSHAIDDQILLGQGEHVIRIQYRTPDNQIIGTHDWNTAVLKIRYYTNATIYED